MVAFGLVSEFQNVVKIWLEQTLAFCPVPEALAVRPMSGPLLVQVTLSAFDLARAATASSFSRSSISISCSNFQSLIFPSMGFYRFPVPPEPSFQLFLSAELQSLALQSHCNFGP